MIAKSKKGWCNEVINHSTCVVVVCVGPTEPCGGISGIRAREQLCDVKKKRAMSSMGWRQQEFFSQHEHF